jgi:hypothetical protein
LLPIEPVLRVLEKAQAYNLMVRMPTTASGFDGSSVQLMERPYAGGRKFTRSRVPFARSIDDLLRNELAGFVILSVRGKPLAYAPQGDVHIGSGTLVELVVGHVATASGDAFTH